MTDNEIFWNLGTHITQAFDRTIELHGGTRDDTPAFPGKSAKEGDTPMTERRYTLTITEAQARVIRDACELLARLGLGQWPEFLRHMPGQVPMEYHNAIDRLLPEMAHLLSEHGPQNPIINGWSSHLGIGNRHVPDAAHTAFDLYAVIRHRLALDEAKDKGWVDDQGRLDPKVFGVQYDTPMHYGEDPLAKMEAAPSAKTEKQRRTND